MSPGPPRQKEMRKKEIGRDTEKEKKETGFGKELSQYLGGLRGEGERGNFKRGYSRKIAASGESALSHRPDVHPTGSGAKAGGHL